MATDRRAAIAANLAAVRARIDRACASAGRTASEVTLVAITKTFPASDVDHLCALGVHDVGENRADEAARKAGELAQLPIRWHFVGQLQTNKCRSVASFATAVHSVDRARLVTALSEAAIAAGRVVDAFIQVSLDDDPRRGGADRADLPVLADSVASAAGLRLVGVMAVAPLGGDPVAAFDRLAAASAELRRRHPEAVGVSAGMSGDLEAAIATGATHVRLGTALLGGRAPLVR